MLTFNCVVSPALREMEMSSLPSVPLEVSTPLTRPTDKCCRSSRASKIASSVAFDCVRVNMSTPVKLRKYGSTPMEGYRIDGDGGQIVRSGENRMREVDWRRRGRFLS